MQEEFYSSLIFVILYYIFIITIHYLYLYYTGCTRLGKMKILIKGSKISKKLIWGNVLKCFLKKLRASKYGDWNQVNFGILSLPIYKIVTNIFLIISNGRRGGGKTHNSYFPFFSNFLTFQKFTICITY